jgi:hypothetical protein
MSAWGVFRHVGGDVKENEKSHKHVQILIDSLVISKITSYSMPSFMNAMALPHCSRKLPGSSTVDSFAHLKATLNCSYARS